jgi:dihydroneopterin aldolase
MQITSYAIEIRDIHLYAHHGVMEQEKTIGAWFTIDTTLHITDSSAAESDDIAATVSYADVYDIIKEEMSTPSKLLEHVCGRVIKRLFATFEIINKIEITLRKDTPPMGGDRLCSAVTLQASR